MLGDGMCRAVLVLVVLVVVSFVVVCVRFRFKCGDGAKIDSEQ